MRENLLSQKGFAKAAKVDQSTVSRLLKGVPKKHGRARARVEQLLRKEGANAPEMDAEIREAVLRVWNGTKKHARAIVGVIEALADLEPRTRKRRATR